MENTYRVTFERIGRTHDVVADFTAKNATALGYEIWHFARDYLGSTWYEVDVDLEAMTGTIERGRFGRFTISAAA